MTVSIDITESAVLTRLRSFILSLITCEVVQGLGNGVPMPSGSFIAITPINRGRLSTNVTTWDDPAGIKTRQQLQLSVQIDCYGPASGDWVTILSTMLRSPEGAAGCGALYCDDPRQMALTNAEAQYELRWLTVAHLQYNPTISTPAEFMDTVGITLSPVI